MNALKEEWRRKCQGSQYLIQYINKQVLFWYKYRVVLAMSSSQITTSLSSAQTGCSLLLLFLLFLFYFNFFFCFVCLEPREHQFQPRVFIITALYFNKGHKKVSFAHHVLSFCFCRSHVNMYPGFFFFFF